MFHWECNSSAICWWVIFTGQSTNGHGIGVYSHTWDHFTARLELIS